MLSYHLLALILCSQELWAEPAQDTVPALAGSVVVLVLTGPAGAGAILQQLHGSGENMLVLPSGGGAVNPAPSVGSLPAAARRSNVHQGLW